jgi:hypothetical protein
MNIVQKLIPGILVLVVLFSGCGESPKPKTAKVDITGRVYTRANNTAYPLGTVGSGCSNATINLSPTMSRITDSAGNYQFLDVTSGFYRLEVNHPNYIPMKFSWDYLESTTENIGIYQAPEAINSRPGFIKGIITWDAGGWIIDYYYPRGLFSSTYDKIQQIGANLVTISDPIFIKAASADSVTMGVQSNQGPWWRMMNETEYTALVNDAHNKGMDFMLWLGVIDEDGASPYWDIVYETTPSSSFWDAWFSEYQTYVLQYTEMAERLGIEYICLGHDMGYVTGSSRFSSETDCLNRWQTLITAIRNTYPEVKVVYFGGVSPQSPYYEDDGYPAGFVDLLDGIGINVQNICATFNPSIDELKGTVTSLLDRYTGFNRPVYIMIRTPSVDGGTSFDTYIEPGLVVDDVANDHQRNLYQQADIYDAFCEVINLTSVGNGRVMGIFPWGYSYLDKFFSMPGKSDGQLAMDKSANIRNKPAEAILEYWYDHF